MDATKDGAEYIFNLKLSKLMGLYQILCPDVTVRIFGRNAYRLGVVSWGLFMMAVSMLLPVGAYRLANDFRAVAFYAGCVQNYVFSCYKIANLLYYSEDIWRCMDVTARGFLSHGRYDRDIFETWRSRSLRLTNAYALLGSVATAVWLVISYALSKNTVAVRNLDGSYSEYRMNIFNLYLIASDRTYNEHFNWFYMIETIVGIGFLYFSLLFDVLMIIMCFSVSCQLETIYRAIELLGHGRCANIEGKIHFENERDVFEDLKAIILDYQNLLQKMKDFYTMFRSVVLLQIFVTSYTHVFIWFIGTTGLMEGESAGESVLSIKLFIILPMFTFQLFMTCSLFGTINEKKDSIVYALYSCNWTYMDIKTKKLILYTMRMNNGNQMKMKITGTKIINMEMFSNTIRMCYSIFSMLINYSKN